MTPAERAAYHREWRDAHPEHAQRLRDRRFAKLAVETSEERVARREKEKAYQAANRERINLRARERRARDPEKARKNEKLYRQNHLEQVRSLGRDAKKRNYFHDKPRIKAHNKLRRAREKGATNTEVILHRVVAERDDWVCHLCGGAVIQKTWSIDHLVPLSLGGDHTYANVRLAHRLCNIRRGNRPLATPLLDVPPVDRLISGGG